MYTEGIKIGLNSYLLSDENGTLTLLNGTGTPEEIEEYIKLKNEYEEKSNEYSVLNNRLSRLYECDKQSKKANREIFLTTFILEGIMVTLMSMANISPIDLFVLVPAISISGGFIGKTIIYGTKKWRTEQKEQIKKELAAKGKEIETLADKMLELYKKIDYWEMAIDEKEDEIIPVTTVENKKVNVKMRVLKLEQSR